MSECIELPKVKRYALVIEIPMEIPNIHNNMNIFEARGMFERKRLCSTIKNHKREFARAVALLNYAEKFDGELETMYNGRYRLNLVISFPSITEMLNFEETMDLEVHEATKILTCKK